MFDRSRLLDRCHRAVGGLRTLGATAVLIALAAADYFDSVNGYVKPALDDVLGENASGKIMVFLPLIFGTLRFMAHSSWRHDGPHDEYNQPTEH